MQFGKNVRFIRKSLGIKQSELARELGINQQTLCEIELRGKRPTAKTLIAISEKLGVSPSDLLNEDLTGVDSKDNETHLYKYPRTVIRVAINRRIKQEAEKLAAGMGLTRDQVLEIWRRETEVE